MAPTKFASRASRLLVAASVTALLSAPSAVAAEPESGLSPSATVIAIQDAEPSVLENTATTQPDVGDNIALDVSTTATDVAVPADPSNPISLTSGTGTSIAINVPFAEQAADAQAITSRGVPYDNKNGSQTVPVVKTDGSVQLTTAIGDSNAPTRYSYELELPDGASVQQASDGAVSITAVDGSFIRGVMPAWAKDSNGSDLPTYYEVDGKIITQVVDHRGLPEASYPVVADPWLGQDLFNETWYSRPGHVPYLDQVVVSARLSNWALYWYFTGSGQPVFRTRGWSERKAKRPRVIESVSMKQQYDCHVTFGNDLYHAGRHWDLEKARPTRNDWVNGIFSHKCNW